MVVVSDKIILEKIRNSEKLKKCFEILENDVEIQAMLKASNINAVERLFYNDHGVVHSRIVAGASLQILDNLILSNAINKSSNLDDMKIIVLFGAYLHDIGNSIHRDMHNLFGAILIKDFLDKSLAFLYENRYKMYLIRQEIMNCVFSHDENIKSISIESGIIKVADGLDMAEGRARIPYKLGKGDIHSFSALSIKKVELEHDENFPIIVKVHMTNESGIFQIEEVLNKKINSSTIKEFVKVIALKNGEEIKSYTYK